jgi:hypothetical protein
MWSYKQTHLKFFFKQIDNNLEVMQLGKNPNDISYVYGRSDNIIV